MRNVKTLWGIIAGLFLCVLVLLLITLRYAAKPQDQHVQDKQEDRVIARIGEREFTYKELHSEMEHKFGAETLNELLDHEAVEQEASDLQLAVSAAEIEKELKRMQSGYESEEQFYKTMKEQLGFSRDDLKRDIRYKLLSEKIAVHDIQISEAEVDLYIRNHPEEFNSYVQYRLSQIIVKTREEADKVIEEIANGADFDELARRRSADQAAAGGDMGWIDSDDPFVDPVILATVKTLKNGEVSRPIPLGDGFAVIRLTQRKEMNRSATPEVRETLRRELALAKAPPVRDVVKSLRNKHGTAILDPDFQ